MNAILTKYLFLASLSGKKERIMYTRVKYYKIMNDLKKRLSQIISEKDKIYVIVDFYRIMRELKRRRKKEIKALLENVSWPKIEKAPPYFKEKIHKQNVLLRGKSKTLAVGSWIGRRQVLDKNEWEALNAYCSKLIGDFPTKILELLK